MRGIIVIAVIVCLLSACTCTVGVNKYPPNYEEILNYNERLA